MSIVQNDRMKDVKLSGIRTIIGKADKLAAEGRDIIRLEIGRPDYDTPQYIKDAAKKALDEGKVHYPPVNGIVELRKAISDKLKRENNLDYTPDEIEVFSGASHVIYCAMAAFLNPGDEVILGDPTYTSYLQVPNMIGAVKKFYTLKEENGFQIDKAQLESLITPKSKMICVINPCNPLGSVLNQESLEAIADVAIKNDLLVLTDEIYERLVYDGKPFTSLASLPGMKERTILLNGFSKWYSMTGWRLGYAAAPKEIVEVLNRMVFYTVTSAASITEWAAVEALNGDNTPSEEMKKEYQRRRDYLVEELNKIDKLSCLKPEGAFYIFLNIKKTGMTSEEFANYMLDEAGVALVHGNEFGSEGEGFVRISYASSMDNLKEAVKRIKAAVDKLN